jgi:hypothetical protein
MVRRTETRDYAGEGSDPSRRGGEKSDDSDERDA